VLVKIWRNWKLCALSLGLQNGVACIENSIEFLKKLKTELPHDPAIPLLDICTKEFETESQRDICMPMFIAA
jgi:hypothetical protein